MAHGQLTLIEFPADDIERAQRFYAELFGWQCRAMARLFSGRGWYALVNDSARNELGLYAGAG
jgi:predicted enzyme related to lactoylglutathione lyase